MTTLSCLNALTNSKHIFLNSSYPEEKLLGAIEKVKTSPRVLGYKDKPLKDMSFVPWIVTFGPGFDESKKMSKDLNVILANSNTWIATPPELPLEMKVVARRAPNIKDLLFKRRVIALSSSASTLVTEPCTNPEDRKRGRPCQSCALMSKTPEIKNNSCSAKSAGGNCKSKCVIYGAQCILCSLNNTYAGKTVQELHCRINAHRHSFYEVLKVCPNITAKSPNRENLPLEIDDTNVLGAHLLLKHGLSDKSAFNKYLRFTILKFATPSSIRQSEQQFIDSLKTLYPFGLNNINSIFG